MAKNLPPAVRQEVDAIKSQSAGLLDVALELTDSRERAIAAVVGGLRATRAKLNGRLNGFSRYDSARDPILMQIIAIDELIAEYEV